MSVGFIMCVCFGFIVCVCGFCKVLCGFYNVCVGVCVL